jgi:DNA-binding GntR family transcriptional regulator
MEIDRRSFVPPYLQAAEQLRELIKSGKITDRLPSAVDISNDAGVAVLTARRALQVLVQEGYAHVRAGMGTYVSPRDEWPKG